MEHKGNSAGASDDDSWHFPLASEVPAVSIGCSLCLRCQ